MKHLKKLKNFNNFLNEEFNENLPYDYEYDFDKENKEEETDYPYQLVKELNRIVPLKSAKGHGDNFSTRFLFTLKNGKSFKYAVSWDENNNYAESNSDGVFEEYIVFNEKRTDIFGTKESVYGAGHDMAGSLDDDIYKKLLYKIGILEDFSAILNVEGYVSYVETFNTKEEAEEVASGWEIQVVSGKHTQGKSLGDASLETDID